MGSGGRTLAFLAQAQKWPDFKTPAFVLIYSSKKKTFLSHYLYLITVNPCFAT